MIRANSDFRHLLLEEEMKTRSKFILIAILSLLAGSAFATPLLLSELNIIPFWTMPEGPKADLGVKVAYTNFTIQNYLSNPDNDTGDFSKTSLEYYIVLNITNHSNIPAKVSNFGFAGVGNTTVTPSALGGFHVVNKDSSGYSGSFIFSGPAEAYLGHVGTGRVEGLWLDGEWINTTSVPEGGLQEIWLSENIFPPKDLEGIWEYNWYPHESINLIRKAISEHPDRDILPLVAYGGTKSNELKQYYTRRGTIFTYEGGNYLIEGVPLREYISDNEVKATVIYYDGSWIDATGRVELEEKPFVFAEDLLMQAQFGFYGDNPDVGENSSFPVGSYTDSSSVDSFSLKFIYDFDNAWGPYESRLVLLSGSVEIGNSWDSDRLLRDNEITVYMELVSYATENVVNGVKVNTRSISTELFPINLERNHNSYIYDSLSLADSDYSSIFDLFDVEVFVLREEQVP